MLKYYYTSKKRGCFTINFFKKMPHRIKNNKKITILIFLIICFLIFFIKKSTIQNEIKEIEIGGPKVALISEKTSEKKSKDKPVPVKEKTNNIKLIHSDDSNVKSAWKNETWTAQVSQQKEPHTINFDSNSLDRVEMKYSFSTALNLEENLIEEWWLDSTNHENEIVGLLSNRNTNQPYRVTIKWITNKGWQPTLVEELISLPKY